jgi:signal transduction histidine kinase
MAREKGVELRADANGLHVRADSTKLKQVLINLLSNALKCTDEGHIEVSAEQRDGEVVFAVRDTGIGIPQSHWEQIFEPFTQLDSSTTRPWAGIGLGLSIVKKYIEMHQGRVWVRSREGEGSAFYFTIPADSEERGES